MGGYDSYKLGLAYPHLFAKALSIAGPPTCGIRVSGDVRAASTGGRCDTDGDTTPLVGNARHIPYVVASGDDRRAGAVLLDPRAGRRVRRAGVPLPRGALPGRGHLSYAMQDASAPPARQLGRTTRERTAARIDYSWYPNLARPELGIGSMGAY